MAKEGKFDPYHNKGVAAHQSLAKVVDVAERGASDPNQFWKMLEQAYYEVW